MKTFDDGGPAFPWGNAEHFSGGLTVLDWFAGQALTGWIIALSRRYGEPGYTDVECSREAGRLAEISTAAALAERARRQAPQGGGDETP